ncbi:MAG TPA: SRPBCC family protein, partial [Bdellovibrio sp.]
MKMQKMTYSIDIKAPQEKVWDTMLKPETYPQWTKAFSEHSEFIGQWKKGERMKFIDKDLGGTVALLETV